MKGVIFDGSRGMLCIHGNIPNITKFDRRVFMWIGVPQREAVLKVIKLRSINSRRPCSRTRHIANRIGGYRAGDKEYQTHDQDKPRVEG